MFFVEICSDQDEAKWICCKEARDFTKTKKDHTLNDVSAEQNDYTWRQKRVHRLMDEGDEIFTTLIHTYNIYNSSTRAPCIALP